MSIHSETKTPTHEQAVATASRRLWDLHTAEDYIAEELTTAALKGLARTAKSAGASRVGIEFTSRSTGQTVFGPLARRLRARRRDGGS